MADINKKILIVEDDKDYLFILQTNFRNEGFSIIAAKDGREGLDLAERQEEELF